MPRYFAPQNGFDDKSIVAIRVDTIDGYAQSVEVHGDGNERNLGSVGRGNVWTPSWTEQELQTMVDGGGWRELKGNEIPAAPASEVPPPPQRTPRRVFAEPRHDESPVT